MRFQIAPIVAAAVGLILAASPMIVGAVQPQIDATVTVGYTCNLNVDMTPLAFGTFYEGQTSSTLTRYVNADANTPLNVMIYGTDWQGTGLHMFGVGQTEYGLDAIPATALTKTTSTGLYSTSVDENHDVSFHVKIPDPQPADTYSQQITVSFECP